MRRWAFAVTLTNPGPTADGTPQVLLTGANAADFAIAASTCTTAIGAGASCAITVAASPSAIGDRTAALVVTASPGGTSTVVLAATGS